MTYKLLFDDFILYSNFRFYNINNDWTNNVWLTFPNRSYPSLSICAKQQHADFLKLIFESLFNNPSTLFALTFDGDSLFCAVLYQFIYDTVSVCCIILISIYDRVYCFRLFDKKIIIF